MAIIEWHCPLCRQALLPAEAQLGCSPQDSKEHAGGSPDWCSTSLSTDAPNGSALHCQGCGRTARILPQSPRFDFGEFLEGTATAERERVGLAYRFYALAYAPLALLNMLTVWRASLGRLVRHYTEALSPHTPPRPVVQVSNPEILDIAVGDGALTLLALRRLGQRRPSSHLCLDIAEDMLTTAERNLAGIPGLRTVRADAGAIPLADGSCDRVCCYGGLHVIAHPERAAVEMRRVLRPGGLFAASILLTPPGPITGYLARRYVKLGFLSTNFTRKSALQMLAEAGFVDLRPEANGHMLLVTGKAPG